MNLDKQFILNEITLGVQEVKALSQANEMIQDIPVSDDQNKLDLLKTLEEKNNKIIVAHKVAMVKYRQIFKKL